MTDFKLEPHPSSRASTARSWLVILRRRRGFYRGRAEGYQANAFDLAATPNLVPSVRRPRRCFGAGAPHGRAVGLPSDDDMGQLRGRPQRDGGRRIFEQWGQAWSTRRSPRARLFRGRSGSGCVDNVIDHGSTFHLIRPALRRQRAQPRPPPRSVARPASPRMASGGSASTRSRTAARCRPRDPTTSTWGGSRARPAPPRELVRARGRPRGRLGRRPHRDQPWTATTPDWEMVRLGWQTHVLCRGRGLGVRRQQAVPSCAPRAPAVIDQDLAAVRCGRRRTAGPVGPIVAAIGRVLTLQGRRALEISRAFTRAGVRAHFDRERWPRRRVRRR